jgi:hypothetical protein
MLVFTCYLDRPTQWPAAASLGKAPSDVNEYEAVIMYACELLALTDAKFHIGGFGQIDWNLDIRYDFSVFMEQYPGLISAVSGNNEIEIGLYSQGLERSLTFFPGPEEVEICCASWTSWVPDPVCEKILSASLESMLKKLAADFSWAVGRIDRNLITVEPFNEWTSWDSK